MNPSHDLEPEVPDPEGTRGALRVVVSGCPDEFAPAIERAAVETLHPAGYRRGTLEIAVIGDREMRRQHLRWLGRPSATDVLSFDFRDRREAGVVDAQLLVCITVARRRARVRATDWRGELLLYVVHGCLHLCGYDDEDAEGAARMHEQEDRLLTALGWGPVFKRSRSPERATYGSTTGRSGGRPT